MRLFLTPSHHLSVTTQWEADGTGRCSGGLREKPELGSDRERRVQRPRLREALTPGCGSAGQRVCQGPRPRAVLPTPRGAGFADAIARPHEPGFPLLPAGTRTPPALSRSPPTQLALEPPFLGGSQHEASRRLPAARDTAPVAPRPLSPAPAPPASGAPHPQQRR